MQRINYTVEEIAKSERLDSFVSSKSGLSRSYIQRLIRDGFVMVNSNKVKASYKIKTGDLIELTIPDEPEETVMPEDIPLDVIWEDENIIIVNKPAGMVVHPSAGHKSGTLINTLIFKCKRLASIGAPLRPGVVHRLDKDTSGIIMFAKDDVSYLNLQRQFKDREVEKHYLALLYGNLRKDRGEIRQSIGRAVSDRKRISTRTRHGKEAITQFEVIKRYKSATLVDAKIITGRTHQIRVHFAASGYPVLGDRTYGKKISIKSGKKIINFNRQMLHAYSLKFKHPISGEYLQLKAPIPEDMKRAIEEMTD
jgi:23S rRNA pseudouridine1911/1915/1917 synthase